MNVIARAGRALEPETRTMLGVFAALLAIYLPTSALEIPASIDPQTNALTAFLIAENLSPIATGYEFTVEPADRVGQTIWLVPSKRGPVSQYPPGAALSAVPLYLLSNAETFERARPVPASFGSDGPLRLPDMWPAAATAAILTSAAMALYAGVLCKIGTAAAYAAGAALTLGLATSMWSVAGDALWQHGPAVFFVALAMWALTRDQPFLAAFSAAMTVLTRPHVGLIVIAIAAGVAIERRHSRSVVSTVAGTGLGIGLLLAYNNYLFGEPTISGGYPSVFIDRMASPDFRETAANFINAWTATDRGILIWSPFIAFLLVGSIAAWRTAPIWVRWSAAGGLSYLVVQFALNRYGGGFDFGFYRYPLEGLMAAAPLGAAAGRVVLDGPRLVASAFRLTIGLSVLAHAFAALWF